MTYPEKFPTVERAKRDIKVFIQRFKRKFPQSGYIWKLEPQERGAPHYHLLVWGCKTTELLAWTVSNWHEIAGDGDINHLRFHKGELHDSKPCVQKVYSFKGVWSYASKYLGKTFEIAEWGNKWTGRFWGIGSRENIPIGEKREIEVSWDQAAKCMRYQRRFIKSKSRLKIRKIKTNSMTIFCNAEHWVKNLLSEFIRDTDLNKGDQFPRMVLQCPT